jgi:hypothetical protein
MILLTDEQKDSLIAGIQFIGFALTENMPEELETVTALEDALIRDNWEPLETILTEDGGE